MMKRRVIYITGPRRNTIPGYWLYDNLVKDGYEVKPFYMRKDDTEKGNKILYYSNLSRIAIYVIFKVTKRDLLLTYDNDTTAIYLSLIISLFRPSLIMHKINCMAGKKGQLYSPYKRFFVKKAYEKIYTTVNNDILAREFSTFLEIPLSHFIPIPDSISDYGEVLCKIKDRSPHGYIFSGGASNRDYPLLLECARKLPHRHFLVVTFKDFQSVFKNAPSNVEIIYGLPEIEFYKKIAHSSLVFVPLNNNLQGGQMVVFQGALLEKPIITTDSIAIKTYFKEQSISLVPIGNTDIAIEKIEELMSNKELCDKKGKAAAKDINRFTTDFIYNQYRTKLFNI